MKTNDNNNDRTALASDLGDMPEGCSDHDYCDGCGMRVYDLSQADRLDCDCTADDYRNMMRCGR